MKKNIRISLITWFLAIVIAFIIMGVVFVPVVGMTFLPCRSRLLEFLIFYIYTLDIICYILIISFIFKYVDERLFRLKNDG